MPCPRPGCGGAEHGTSGRTKVRGRDSDTDGWDAPRLTPILAGLTELVPWLQQWHNDIDPAYGERLGDFYAAFIAEERRALGLTPEDVDRERLD